MNSAVFLQVRLDSTRLPRKALALLGGRTVTERCLAALNGLTGAKRVLVTEPDSVHELEPLAHKAGWEVFSGSKDDVLDRFVQAARLFQVDTVVRATGDNPLVSCALARELLARHYEHRADYSCYEGAPLGTGVEVLSVNALEAAWSGSPDPYEREHVSPHLYRRPERFRIDKSPVAVALRYPKGRVTLDTQEDLDYLEALWDDLRPDEPLEVEALIPWLKRHPR